MFYDVSFQDIVDYPLPPEEGIAILRFIADRSHPYFANLPTFLLTEYHHADLVQILMAGGFWLDIQYEIYYKWKEAAKRSFPKLQLVLLGLDD